MRAGIVYLGRKGSGGALAFEIAQHLNAEASLCSFLSRQSEQYPRWQSSGLPHLAVDTFESAPGALASLINDRPIRGLAESIRAFHPEALIFPMLHPWNPRLQSLLPEIPSIVMVHDASPHAGPVDRVYSWIENQSIRRAGWVITFSQAMLPFVLRRGAKVERASVIPLPVTRYYHHFQQDSSPQGAPARRLLFFGRVTSYKGLEVLLRAYRKLDESARLPLHIVGAGSLAGYQAELQNCPGLVIENRWVADEEIPGYFTPGTILVLPYTSATQSGVIAAAAAFGLPVIASRVGGIPEQIQDGVTGLLVDPGEVGQLSQAIQRLVRNPRLAAELGARLHETVETERGWPVTTRRLLAVLEQVSRPLE